MRSRDFTVQSQTLATLTAANSPEQRWPCRTTCRSRADRRAPCGRRRRTAHRTLAQSSADAAESTRTATAHRDAEAKQQEITDAAIDRHAQARDRLQPGGDLHATTRPAEAGRECRPGRDARASSGAPPPAPSRALQRANADLTLAQNAINVQQTVVAQLLTCSHVERGNLATCQNHVQTSGPLETTAQQQDQHRVAANNADATARASARARDRASSPPIRHSSRSGTRSTR